MRIRSGQKWFSFEIPDKYLLGVFSPKSIKVVDDLDQEVLRALNNPLNSSPLDCIVNPGDRVVLLVDDHTRETPTVKILAHVLEQISRAGVKDRNLNILVARGTHRPLMARELEDKIGINVLKRFRVIQHDCHKEDEMAFAGITRLGTPVWINRLVLEADKRIGIGHIGPSPYAGYSGAGKLIVPGAASIDTVNFNHSFIPLIFRKIGHMGREFHLITRQDIDEAAALVGMELVVNVVMNTEGKVVKAFAGKPESVFEEGLKLARRIHEVELPGSVDIALTSGNPYSIDLYQAMRAAEYADIAVNENGAILLLADCPDGEYGVGYALRFDRCHRHPGNRYQ